MGRQLKTYFPEIWDREELLKELQKKRELSTIPGRISSLFFSAIRYRTGNGIASKIRESCGRTGKENFSFYAIVVNFGKVKKSCTKHLTQVSGYNRISEVSI